MFTQNALHLSMFIGILLRKTQAFLKVNEGSNACVEAWNISISCEFLVTWLVPFLLQLFIQLRARIMKHVREKKEPMRIQWIQLFIWKAPQTHTIAFCCLIFNIDKHNCIYLSSQYWKQAIICNITTLHLKGTQAQQFPVPSEGGEWHGGGWIAYAGEAHIIFFPMRIY